MRRGWSRIFQWLSRKCSSGRGVGRKVKVCVGVIVVIGWGPSFIAVSLMGPQHSRRLIGNTWRPRCAPSFCPTILPWCHWFYLVVQVVSFLLIQSHQLACSAAFERDLMPRRWAWPRMSTSHSRFTVDFPTKNSHIFNVCSSAWSQVRRSRELEELWLGPDEMIEPDVRLGSWQGIIHR